MNILIVGNGLAGAVACQLLAARHTVTIACGPMPHGLCADTGGIQRRGPHVFHTSSPAVLDFIHATAKWIPLRYEARTYTGPMLRALPLDATQDDAFRVYSEKAWGCSFAELPDAIRNRVPARPGPYHLDEFSGQPVGGYSAWIDRMTAAATHTVCCRRASDTHSLSGTFDATIWTGDINDIPDFMERPLPWVRRSFAHHGGTIAQMAIHYADHTVPQLRTWSCERINPAHPGPGLCSEFPGGRTGVPCYPDPFNTSARARVDEFMRAEPEHRIYLAGRLGTYQYLDMDETIENVTATIERAGL